LLIGYCPLTCIFSSSGSEGYAINVADQEKLFISHAVQVATAGASTAPERDEMIFKWANTTEQMTQLEFKNKAAGSYDIGSRVIVWGHD